ncbi:SWIB/MDM2 domain-containing protein [Chitinophaga cymbidii]|nr:SWIB/MDM2 domain-containing protein [Chitinophaga cymbidii]
MTAAKATTTKKAGAGLQAPLTPSPALAAVVGSQPLPRTEIVKKMWDYIKANGLQDQNNKRMINADGKLKEIFGGKDQVSMFELPKLISVHVK